MPSLGTRVAGRRGCAAVQQCTRRARSWLFGAFRPGVHYPRHGGSRGCIAGAWGRLDPGNAHRENSSLCGVAVRLQCVGSPTYDTVRTGSRTDRESFACSNTGHLDPVSARARGAEEEVQPALGAMVGPGQVWHGVQRSQQGGPCEFKGSLAPICRDKTAMPAELRALECHSPSVHPRVAWAEREPYRTCGRRGSRLACHADAPRRDIRLVSRP